MKKYSLLLFIGAITAYSPLLAQQADTTVAMDSAIIEEIPNRSGAAGETSEFEGLDEKSDDPNDPFVKLRKQRQERERIDSSLEDVIAYPLNLESPTLGSFQVLDSIADHNRFIFTGEDHRVEKLNTTLEMKMMQYLSTRGYRYYIMEAGWVSAWMVNRYIVDGDSAAEQILSTYYSRNFFNMFKGMKETNDSLKEGEKIRAVGLDIERDAPLALRSLLLMLPDQQAPDSLEMFVESLKILSNIHIQQAMEYAKNASDDDELFDFG
ncbi:MAG: erythromycin esterase family protein, partial [Bacteroidota bacterium]|nr:erythromycin esterase family protein [Bacteroidota bacterium]MDX5429998.1 erythromycin esterase family protein [Bacteroidota bacterium]MDX5468771.1 erythromycin esterase family protein [Bacteroidota bacterium]